MAMMWLSNSPLLLFFLFSFFGLLFRLGGGRGVTHTRTVPVFPFCFALNFHLVSCHQCMYDMPCLKGTHGLTKSLLHDTCGSSKLSYLSTPDPVRLGGLAARRLIGFVVLWGFVLGVRIDREAVLSVMISGLE